MSQKSILEKLEEGFVFRISRSFFLILVILAMLGILSGIFYLVWSFLPTSKEFVMKDPDPKPVLITVKDIKSAMSSPIATEVHKSSPAFSAQELEIKPDLDSVRFMALIDTLNILLPSSLYSWQSTGYWTYPYGQQLYEYYHTDEYRRWNVDKPGISDQLRELFSGTSSVKDAVVPLKQLCKVLVAYPETNRLKPFNTFIDLYQERQAEYIRTIKQNEDNYQFKLSEVNSKYEATVLNKSIAKLQSLIIIGSGIASVAFLAIFLVLLSMQRNLKELVSADQDD